MNVSDQSVNSKLGAIQRCRSISSSLETIPSVTIKLIVVTLKIILCRQCVAAVFLGLTNTCCNRNNPNNSHHPPLQCIATPSHFLSGTAVNFKEETGKNAKSTIFALSSRCFHVQLSLSKKLLTTKFFITVFSLTEIAIAAHIICISLRAAQAVKS